MSAILAPVDGTRQSASALPVARALADLEHANLHIVHVATQPLTPGALLDQLQLEQAEVHGAVISPLMGPPGQAIAQYALGCRARFIVMCARTGAEWREGALGGAAREILAATACPAVLVPPNRGVRPWTLRRLVLCHDGAPASSAAVSPASDLAERSGAELDVLHVAGPRAVPGAEPGTLRVPRYVDQPQHEWQAWQREFLDRVCGFGRGAEAVHLQLHLAIDKPASAIVRFAVDHQSDLVILAWRGRLEADRASILRAVVAAAPCAVLVVRIST